MHRETTLNKLPPQSIEAEESVLSTILLDNTVLPDSMAIIKSDDFYRSANDIIYQCMIDLYKKSIPCDLTTIIDRLRSINKLEDIGGGAYLASLLDSPASTNFNYHCKLIKEKSALRQLIHQCNEITTNCFNGDDAENIIDTAQSSIIKINLNQETKSIQRIGDTVIDVIEIIEERSKTKNHVTGIATGFERFDKMTAGLQRGELNILAARPSMGKTAMAIQIARNAAEVTPVLVFELEMTKEQLTMRQIASESRVDFSRVRIGWLNPEDWQRITDSAGLISELPIFIDDQPGLNIMEMRRRIKKYHREHNIGLVIVDYIQIMDINKGNQRVDREIAEISMGLKNIAKELNISVLLLSQLNRNLEQRMDKHPRLSDLRESGALEQDADTVSFIYRDEVYNDDENNPNRGVAELIIAKQRNGPIGTVPLTFLKAFLRFENAF